MQAWYNPHSTSRLSGIDVPNLHKATEDEEGQYKFYQGFIDPADKLYPALLLFFYSSEIQIVKEPRGKPIKTAGGTEIQEYDDVPKLKRLPDSKRRCPLCYEVRDDGDWDVCKGAAEKPHDAAIPKFINWKPLCTSAGFEYVANLIRVNLSQPIATGNLPQDKSFNFDKFQRRIINLAHKVDEVLYVHRIDYVNPDIYLSQAIRESIEGTIIQNLLGHISGSIGGKTADRVTKQTSVEEKHLIGSEKNDAGLKSKLQNWWSWH